MRPNFNLSSGQIVNGLEWNNANKNLDSTGPYFDSPISRIPNVLDVFVEVRGNDRLFAAHGIEKRIPSRLHVVVGGNKKSNNYLAYVDYRLRSSVGNPANFWRYAKLVMKHSNVFKSLMIQELFPTWSRDMTLKELYLLIAKYNDLLVSQEVQILHRRVYIPKKVDAETKEILSWRPLGVPTTTWRLYLHTWQCLLMIFLGKEIHKNQHGYFKGRGTATAWGVVLEEVINAKSIYEFDFKQFFPSVNVSMVSLLLNKVGLPKEICDYLLSMNLSYPKESSIDESKGIDETASLEKAELDSINLLRLDPNREIGLKGYKYLSKDFKYTGKLLKPMFEIVIENMREASKQGYYIDGMTLLKQEVYLSGSGLQIEDHITVTGQSSVDLWTVDSKVLERISKLLKEPEGFFKELMENFALSLDDLLAYLLSSISDQYQIMGKEFFREEVNYRKSVLNTIITSREKGVVKPPTPVWIDPSPNPPKFNTGEECISWHLEKGGLEILRQMYEFYQLQPNLTGVSGHALPVGGCRTSCPSRAWLGGSYKISLLMQ
jgi:hypothetical protein